MRCGLRVFGFSLPFEHRRVDGAPRLKVRAKPPATKTTKVNSVNEGAADPGLEVQKPTAQTFADADSNPTTAHDDNVLVGSAVAAA
jgi:hypothetical protein